MHQSHPSLILLPLLLLLAGCGDGAVATRPPTFVRTEVARLHQRQATIRLTGDVQARVRTELSFRVSGRVTERLVDVGAHVNNGDVLAKIDPTEQQADLEGSKAGLSAARAQLRVATATFERQKMLMASGFTTKVAYDQAQEALKTAEGSLEAAEAQLGRSADLLSYTELRASAAGIITARNIEVGQVAQSAQSAYTLAQDGTRDGVFDVQELFFLRQADSDIFRITLLSDPEVTASAKAREISPTVDPKSATVRVKVAILDAPAAMTLGSSIAIEAREKPVGKLVLPSNALTADVNGPAVWVIDTRSNTVSLKSIAVETYESNSFVVRSGLQIGERIVTEGGKLLRPGQIVTFDRIKT